MRYTEKTKQKSLGKRASALLQNLLAQGKNVFGLAEAQTITQTSYDATRLLVGNLVQQGWVARIKKGKFLILSLEEPRASSKHWQSIVRSLVDPFPYYIAYYAALSIHSLTTHPFSIIYVATPRRIKNRALAGLTLKFIYCPPKKLWGTENQWINKQEKITVSDLEKTLIDALSRLDLCGGLSEVAKGIWIARKKLNLVKLIKYSRKQKNLATQKRLGYLLELYKIADPATLNQLCPKDTNLALLDPTLPKAGAVNKKWKLQLNSNPAELKKIIWT